MLGFKIEGVQREGDVNSKVRPIYLDLQVGVASQRISGCSAHFYANQATTPMDPRVLDAMLPFYTDQWGNPHSKTHAYGWEAEKAVEEARQVCVSHYQ